MRHRIPSVWKDEIQERIANRHYYLKMAYNFSKLKQFSDVHLFCRLAELEQVNIDEFTKFYGIESLRLHNK